MTAQRAVSGLLFFAALQSFVHEVGSARPSAAVEVQLNLVNDMDEPINCFWKNSAGDSHLLLSLERGTSTALNTYMGHVFEFRVAFGGASQSMQGKLLGTFTVQSDADVLVSRIAAGSDEQVGKQKPQATEEGGAAAGVPDPSSEDGIPTWQAVVASADTDPNANQEAIRISQEVLKVAQPGVPRRPLSSKAQGVKFRSLLDYEVRIYWDSGKGLGTPQGMLYPEEDSTTNSYIGHTFVFRMPSTEEEVARITVRKGQVLYLIQDGSEVKDKKKLRETMEQLSFMKAYEEKAGRPWVASYPKEPLSMYMLPAEQIGENKTVVSRHGLFHCVPESKTLPWDPAIHSDCSPEEDLELTLTTLSTEPRVFLIEGFFSAEEAAHIRSIAEPRLSRSSVGNSKKARGGYVASTRTSRTAWVGRTDSPVIDRLHRRAADVLGIPQERIWSNGTGIAEQLQVGQMRPWQGLPGIVAS